MANSHHRADSAQVTPIAPGIVATLAAEQDESRNLSTTLQARMARIECMALAIIRLADECGGSDNDVYWMRIFADVVSETSETAMTELQKIERNSAGLSFRLGFGVAA